MQIVKVLAVAAAAVVVSACGSDPYRYSEPRYVPSQQYAAPSGNYSEVGRVVAIDAVRDSGGRPSGAGAVIGGIVGGVLGHQIGSGRGNDAATVVGAIGGAVVGNNLERQRGGDEYFRVTVEFRDGRQSAFGMDSLNGVRVGDRERVDGDRLYRD